MEGAAGGRTRVAQGPHGVLGFATLTVVDDRDGELEDLFVDPRWHRHGVARALVTDAVAALRASGLRRLWVVGNVHALAFYRSVGFVGGEVVTSDPDAGHRGPDAGHRGPDAGPRLHLDV